MSDPDPHYTLSLSNHQTGQRLKIELFDLPFPGARSYASKSMANGRASFLLPAKPWWQNAFVTGLSGTRTEEVAVAERAVISWAGHRNACPTIEERDTCARRPRKS